MRKETFSKRIHGLFIYDQPVPFNSHFTRKRLLNAFSIIILLFMVYKVSRELFWVRRASIIINKNLRISVASDDDLAGFLDIGVSKRLTISNIETKASTILTIESIEPEIYFYIDETPGGKVLRVADKWLGQNKYNYNTLKLLPGEEETLAAEDNLVSGSREFPKDTDVPVITLGMKGFY